MEVFPVKRKEDLIIFPLLIDLFLPFNIKSSGLLQMPWSSNTAGFLTVLSQYLFLGHGILTVFKM